MPIQYKTWFIDRLSQELSRNTSKEGGTASRAAHADTPDARAMQGRIRSQVPSRLRRFT